MNDEAVTKGSGWVIVLGVLTILLGVFAIGSPLVAGGAVAIYVGVLLLAGGIFELVGAIGGHGRRSGALAVVSGLLGIVCGLFLLAAPLRALLTLTLLLAIYFVVDGIGKIIVAFKLKPEQGWGVLLFGGIVTLLLGLLIWRQWPLSGAWAIGTLVGINLIFGGWALVAVGSSAR